MGKNAKIMSIATIVIIVSMLSVTLITSDFSSGESFTAENGVIYQIEGNQCSVIGFDSTIVAEEVTIPGKVDYKSTPFVVKGIMLEGTVDAKITKLSVFVADTQELKTYDMTPIQIPTLESFSIVSPSVLIGKTDYGWDLMSCFSYCPKITEISIEGRSANTYSGAIYLNSVPSTVESLKIVGRLQDVVERNEMLLDDVCTSENLKELYIGNVALQGGDVPEPRPPGINSTTFYNCPNLDKVTIGDNVDMRNAQTFCNLGDSKLGTTHFIEIGNNVRLNINTFYTQEPTISGFIFKGEVRGYYDYCPISEVFGCANGAYNFESSDSEDLEYVEQLSRYAFVGNNGTMKETDNYTVSFEIEGSGSLTVDSLIVPISAHATVAVDESEKNRLIISWGSSSVAVIAVPESGAEFVYWGTIPQVIDNNVTIKAFFTEAPGPAPTPTPPTPTPSEGNLSIDPTVAFVVVIAVFIVAMLALVIIVRRK